MSRTRIVVLAAALALFFLALWAGSVYGNTINLPYVARSRPEPTIAVDATATPFVSIGPPWVGDTPTPTITPELMATVTPAGVR